MSKSGFVLGLWLMLFAALGPVFADRASGPEDYRIETRNKKFVFIMFSPEKWLGQDKQLRDKYPETGLYKTNDSSHPLWSVSWYAFKIFVSSDGKYLVRMGDWPRGSALRNVRPDPQLGRYYESVSMTPPKTGEPSDDLKQLAVAFYREGKLIKEYLIRDLVTEPKVLPQSVSHFEWCDGSDYNPENDQLTVKTMDGHQYTFNAKTGLIVEEAQNQPAVQIGAPDHSELISNTRIE